MKCWLILLALLSTGCSSMAESWSPRYHAKHSPGDRVEAGELDVAVRAYPASLVSPDRVTFTLFIRGAVPDCGSIAWTWPDGDSSVWSGCGMARSDRKVHLVRCIGMCSTVVRVFDAEGRLVARGSAVVIVGGEA